MTNILASIEAFIDDEVFIPLANKTPLGVISCGRVSTLYGIFLFFIAPKIIQWVVFGQYHYLCNHIKLQCPHCNAWQGGFVGSPAGRQFYCDSDLCEKSYYVHPDAEIGNDSVVKSEFINKLS